MGPPPDKKVKKTINYFNEKSIGLIKNFISR
jgi:hypothetical protein